MTKLLNLSPELSPPLDALMQPIALLGNRGAGKTFAGMKIFELAHDAEVQSIAIDGIGKWWGLRLAGDGRSPGLKDVYIFGGKRADFPITPDRGGFVARVLVERRIHAILDVSQMRKGDRRRFLTDFAEEFHLLKKQEDQPTPSVLFLEEAHQVLPQKPFGEEARMLGAFEDLIREGRNAGIGMVIMDQRPATVNKNALALIEILIALRTTYEIDRKVYVGWVVQKVADDKLKVDLEAKLPFLKAGEGFLYAPMFDLFEHINIFPKRTFDSSATAKIGVKVAAIGTLSPVDVERVKGAMAEVTAEVAAKDPVALRQKVAQLEKQLAAKAPAAAAKPVEVPAITGAERKHLEELLVRAERLAEKSNDATGALRDAFQALAQKVVGLDGTARQLEQSLRPPAPKLTAVPVRARPANTPVSHEDVEGPTKYARHLLQTLANRQPMRPTRTQIAILSARSTKSSAFDVAMAEIGRMGWAVEDRGQFAITEAGLAVVGGVAPAATSPEELRRTWLNALESYERTLLEVLIREFPNGMTKPEIAQATGRSLTSSAFDVAISTLKKNHLVDDGGGLLTASSILFQEAA